MHATTSLRKALRITASSNTTWPDSLPGLLAIGCDPATLEGRRPPKFPRRSLTIVTPSNPPAIRARHGLWIRNGYGHATGLARPTSSCSSPAAGDTRPRRQTEHRMQAAVAVGLTDCTGLTEEIIGYRSGTTEIENRRQTMTDD